MVTSGDNLAEDAIGDGAPPPPAKPPRRARKTHWSPLELLDEPAAEERAARRRLDRVVFRVYCLACGRSSEVAVPPAQAGRCVHCNGTMLVDVAPS